MAGIGSERDTADLAAFHACLVVRGIPAIHADVAVTADRFAGRRMGDWGFICLHRLHGWGAKKA